MPIRTYTKARVQSYARCRDASANDRVIYIFPARFSSPSSTGPLKSEPDGGARMCVDEGGGGGREVGARFAM